MKGSEITVVTGNKSKFREISTILLEEASLSSRLYEMDLMEPKLLSLEETSKFKAQQAWRELHSPLITDDTGIIFEGLKDFPGSYTKVLYQMVGIDGMLKIVKGLSRKAQYKTVLTFTADGVEYSQFTGTFSGTIALSASSTLDEYFPYDSIFIPTGSDMPRSEMDEDQQIKGSHRRMAIKQMAAYLRSK